MSGDKIVVLGAGRHLRARYPEWVSHGAAALPVVAGSDDASLSEFRVICLHDAEPSIVEAAVRSGRPMLVDLPTLVKNGPPDGRWVPYLPSAWSEDARFAVQEVAVGAIGMPQSISLTTFIGPLETDGCQVSEPFAATRLEAAAFGIDLAVSLGDAKSCTWQRQDKQLSEHWGTMVADGPPFMSVDMAPQSCSGVPLWTGFVMGTEGSLHIRSPFAPGVVALFGSSRQTYRSPALRRPKSHIQAPDTARGGLALATLLAGMANDEPLETERVWRDRAIAALDEVSSLWKN